MGTQEYDRTEYGARLILEYDDLPPTKMWKGVVNHYRGMPDDVIKYFSHLPALCESFPFDVVLAYVFARVEMAHHLMLYCGLVKMHHAHCVITRNVIQGHHFTRNEFDERFETVFGRRMKDEVRGKLRAAENVRDLVMHGKDVADSRKRAAVVSVLDYARAVNIEVGELAKFSPFRDLRGFKGRAKPLDQATTRWLLRGMGFKA